MGLLQSKPQEESSKPQTEPVKEEMCKKCKCREKQNKMVKDVKGDMCEKCKCREQHTEAIEVMCEKCKCREKQNKMVEEVKEEMCKNCKCREQHTEVMCKNCKCHEKQNKTEPPPSCCEGLKSDSKSTISYTCTEEFETIVEKISEIIHAEIINPSKDDTIVKEETCAVEEAIDTEEETKQIVKQDIEIFDLIP